MRKKCLWVMLYQWNKFYCIIKIINKIASMWWTQLIKDIYQVLHLLLKPGHGLLRADGKHKGVHVLVIKCHFDLLQTDRQTSLARWWQRVQCVCSLCSTSQIPQRLIWIASWLILATKYAHKYRNIMFCDAVLTPRNSVYMLRFVTVVNCVQLDGSVTI